jgi:uncharacterized protein
MFSPLEFFHFLRSPKYPVNERKETHVLKTTLKIYLLSLLSIGLVNLIITIMVRLFLTLPIDETFDVPDKFKNHLWVYFLLVVVVSPVVEEILFRLSLIFNPVNISLSVSLIIAFIINRFSNHLVAIISLIMVFFLIFKLTTIYKLNLISFWKKKFKFIFYFLPISFGLVHMTNYKYTESYQYLLVPLIVFPQLAIGFILSFTRLYYKKGFMIGIFIHITMNLISFSGFLLQYLK